LKTRRKKRKKSNPQHYLKEFHKIMEKGNLQSSQRKSLLRNLSLQANPKKGEKVLKRRDQ
jgi:hypothetical protein